MKKSQNQLKVTVAGLKDDGSLLTQGSKFKSPAFMNIPGAHGIPSVTSELADWVSLTSQPALGIHSLSLPSEF